MKKYRAIKDVPYWGIKAGEVYEQQVGGFGIPFIRATASSIPINPEPLLEAGIIEEVPERLTVENIQMGCIYWFLSTNGVSSDTWTNHLVDRKRARFGLFRTQEEALVRDRKVVALCEEEDAKNE